MDFILVGLCAGIFAVGLYLHGRVHRSIEQRLDSLFDRLCALEHLPKSEPIISPLPEPTPSAPTAPKKRPSREKKA